MLALLLYARLCSFSNGFHVVKIISTRKIMAMNIRMQIDFEEYPLPLPWKSCIRSFVAVFYQDEERICSIHESM